MTLIGPEGSRLELEALVDTGSSFTSVPAPLLEQLGVQPQRSVRLRLADGTSHLQQLGRVLVEIDGTEEVTLVVFGEPGSPPVIGAYTLEGLLLGVDPFAQTLVPVEGWRV